MIVELLDGALVLMMKVLGLTFRRLFGLKKKSFVLQDFKDSSIIIPGRTGEEACKIWNERNMFMKNLV